MARYTDPHVEPGFSKDRGASAIGTFESSSFLTINAQRVRHHRLHGWGLLNVDVALILASNRHNLMSTGNFSGSRNLTGSPIIDGWMNTTIDMALPSLTTLEIERIRIADVWVMLKAATTGPALGRTQFYVASPSTTFALLIDNVDRVDTNFTFTYDGSYNVRSLQFWREQLFPIVGSNATWTLCIKQLSPADTLVFTSWSNVVDTFQYFGGRRLDTVPALGLQSNVTAFQGYVGSEPDQRVLVRDLVNSSGSVTESLLVLQPSSYYIDALASVSTESASAFPCLPSFAYAAAYPTVHLDSDLATIQTSPNAYTHAMSTTGRGGRQSTRARCCPSSFWYRVPV